MLIAIRYNNDGTGLLDDELRDGDIVEILPDSAEAGLAGQQLKSYLWLHIPDVTMWDGTPVNFDYVKSRLKEEEYAADGTIRRARKYWINYATRFTQSELAVIRDPLQTKSVVHDKFTQEDILRKN